MEETLSLFLHTHKAVEPCQDIGSSHTFKSVIKFLEKTKQETGISPMPFTHILLK